MTSRVEIKRVLQAWRQGEKDELAVWRWAESAKQAGAPQDGLVRDLVDCLALLPFDMVVVEDAAVMLDALANPVDETDLSINLLWNHLDGIDVDERRTRLHGHPFYGQFCDGMQ